ncbi:ATP-grasp fold amidoligase family protein [Maribacter dokdonensis]|uniref:ATP-grasp fold amidoligase family protein n=1 Tax=Maribacter dokdonensis TaxID=320912 RepID=UPI003299883A
MKKIFIWIYHKTLFGKLLIYVFHTSKNRLWPDIWVIRYNYWKRRKRFLNLKNPKTLNEKINWLKLYDKRPLHTQCADKYEVRSYIKNKIGEEYLVQLYFHTQNPNDLKPEIIPDYPCIIKTNHDSGGGKFVYNQNELDYNKLREEFKRRLSENYYHKTKEWQYKNIVPRIIVEKLLLTNDGSIPLDYKVHCFNGKAHMIQVDIGRGTVNHYRNWYYTDWTRCPFKWTSISGNKITNPAEFDVPPPKELKKMCQLSNELAEPFDYARVDWYDLDDKLFFGEITFHHDSGCRPIEPEEWDYKLGEMINLTKRQK